MSDTLYDLYLEYVKPFKGSKRFHSWAIISAGAALLERKVWLPLGGLGQIHPNMFIVLCGGPGLGKTTVSTLTTKLIKTMNKRLGVESKGVFFGPDKVTPAALLKRFKTSTRTLKAETGECFEESALYLHSTELSTMIKDIGGGSLSDDLLKLYDCDDYFEKELVSEGVIMIPGPCLNFIADTTPSFLSGFLPREESGTGLTARMIFATELGAVEIDEEVPDGDKVLYERIINHMSRMFRMSGAFRVESNAKVYWGRWFREYRDKLFTLNEGTFMRHFYARKPVHLRKLAMVLSAGRDSGRVILQSDFERALEIINEAEPFMDKSFGVKDFRKVDDSAKVIFDAIPMTPKETAKSKLIQALFTNGLSGDVQDLDNVIKTLLEGKMITRRVEGNETFFTKIV